MEGETTEPEQVLESFERSLNAHRVDVALRSFSADAVVQHNQALSGSRQVRGWIEQRADENVHLHMDRDEVSGERVRWRGEMGSGEWYNRRDESPPRVVQGEAIVRNGHIVRYSLEVVGARGSQAPSAEAVAAGVSPDLFGVLPGGTIAAALALLASGWLRRRPARQVHQPVDRRHAPGLVQVLGGWAAARRS